VKSKDAYKVQIKIGDAEVNVEGAESGVVKIVEALSDVLRGSRKTPISPAAGSISSAVPASTRSASTDIRSFFAEKKTVERYRGSSSSSVLHPVLSIRAQPAGNDRLRLFAGSI
jgi:hypothetical protein